MSNLNEELLRQKRLMEINESNEEPLDEGLFDSIKAGIGTLGQMGKQFRYIKAVNNWNKVVKTIQKDLDTIVNMVNNNANKLQQANQAFNVVRSLGTQMAGFNQKQAVNDNLNRAFNSFTDIVAEINQVNTQMQQAAQQTNQQNTQMANNLLQTAQQNPQNVNSLVPYIQQLIQSLEANGQQSSEQHQQLVDLISNANNGDPNRGTNDVQQANDTINQMHQDGEGINTPNNTQPTQTAAPATRPVPPQPTQPVEPVNEPDNNSFINHVQQMNKPQSKPDYNQATNRTDDVSHLQQPQQNVQNLKPTKGLNMKQNVNKIKNKLDRFDDVEESVEEESLTETIKKLKKVLFND